MTRTLPKAVAAAAIVLSIGGQIALALTPRASAEKPQKAPVNGEGRRYDSWTGAKGADDTGIAVWTIQWHGKTLTYVCIVGTTNNQGGAARWCEAVAS